MARNTDVLTAAEIDSFTRKLKATLALADEAVALRGVLGKLGASFGSIAPSKGRAAGGAAPAARTAGRRKRRPALAADKVLAALKGEKNGASAGTLAKKIGDDRPRVQAALRELRDQKKVTLKGEKRNALWFAT